MRDKWRNIASTEIVEGIKLNSLNITFVSPSSSGMKMLLARATFDLNCYPSEWTIFARELENNLKRNEQRKCFFFQCVTDLWFKALFIRVPFLELLHIHRTNALLQFMFTVPNKAGYLPISRIEENENEEKIHCIWEYILC